MVDVRGVATPESLDVYTSPGVWPVSVDISPSSECIAFGDRTGVWVSLPL